MHAGLGGILQQQRDPGLWPLEVRSSSNRTTILWCFEAVATGYREYGSGGPAELAGVGELRYYLEILLRQHDQDMTDNCNQNSPRL